MGCQLKEASISERGKGGGVRERGSAPNTTSKHTLLFPAFQHRRPPPQHGLISSKATQKLPEARYSKGREPCHQHVCAMCQPLLSSCAGQGSKGHSAQFASTVIQVFIELVLFQVDFFFFEALHLM